MQLTAVPDQLPLSRRSVSWRVNAEPGVFLGGGRALLMQVSHPGVGAGVEQYSSYASDPWGRLFRTIDVMMKLSFGTPVQSARQQRLLANMHRRVVGTTDDGTPYSAMDPALQLWVWATLVDTAYRVYERLQGRLRPEELAQFYEEQQLVAYGCGVPRGGCPASWSEFQQYVDDVVATELRVTRAARAVAEAAMVPPLPGPAAALAGVPQRLVTVGLLPPSLRQQFGYQWTNADQRRLRHVWRAAALANRATPAPVRYLNAELTLRRSRPLRAPWLQRKGGEMTMERLEAAGLA